MLCPQEDGIGVHWLSPKKTGWPARNGGTRRRGAVGCCKSCFDELPGQGPGAAAMRRRRPFFCADRALTKGVRRHLEVAAEWAEVCRDALVEKCAAPFDRFSPLMSGPRRGRCEEAYPTSGTSNLSRVIEPTDSRFRPWRTGQKLQNRSYFPGFGARLSHELPLWAEFFAGPRPGSGILP